MDFDVTEEQEILRKTARDFLTSKCPTSLVRAVEENKQGYAAQLWEQIADLGWVGFAVPEDHGGGGGSFMDLCIIMEEMGRALAPVPFIPVVLCQYAIMEAGSPEQKSRFLPSLASGQSIMTIALHDSDFPFEPEEILAKATKKDGSYILSGTKLFVPYGIVAGSYLVVARTGGQGEKGVSLFVLDRSALTAVSSRLGTIASNEQCEVGLDKVKVGEERLLGREGEGWPIAAWLSQRGAVLKCAEMVGAAQWVLEKTVEYAKVRVQFDRPIGTFQAIQHKCADLAIACDGAKFATYQAAWLLSEGVACEREIAIAKGWVSEAHNRICFGAHQIHGAIGWTREYDLQLYTRRAKEAELAFGDTRFHYEALAHLLGLGT
jgi:alkylation response protein AidB-like acyl-CoA dehydrogenase